MSEPALYDLLPAVHRVRDAEQDGALAALLSALERELQVLDDDVEQLYDNWFIETCEEWVVPYIGDLLGVRGLIDVSGAGLSQRGLVANTIAYRRRKGTAAVLEQLARDVTGWPAKAVEYFDLLATTQHVNHVRQGKGGTADLRAGSRLELLGGAFDTFAHTGEVRHVDNRRGRHDIPNVGLFLWRLETYAHERTRARAVTGKPKRFLFDPLGFDTPLFNRPRTETGGIQELAGEVHAAGPLRRRALRDEQEGRSPERALFLDPADPVFAVWLPGKQPVPPGELAICDLSDPDREPPAGATVAVDPQLGRLALKDAVDPNRVEVSWAQAFAGDLGGGPYDRRASLAGELPDPPEALDWHKGVVRDAPGGSQDLFGTLTAALGAWDDQPRPSALISIMDSHTYEGDVEIDVPAGCRLVIAAADWPEERDPLSGLPVRREGRVTADGVRPHLRGNVVVRGVPPAAGEEPGELVLDGLLIEGTITVDPGSLGLLRLAHTTVAPRSADPAFTGRLTALSGNDPAERNVNLEVELERAICGPLAVTELGTSVTIVESIVDGRGGPAIAGKADGTETAPACAIERSTILGPSAMRTIEASDSILTGRVAAERRQTGCVRYSFVPLDSRVPRRFRCAPADAQHAARIVPAFTADDYGEPGYAQLSADTPDEIARGADDEGQMGAFNFVREAHRVANLRTRIDEYLRFGLEAGIFYAS